MLSKDEIINLVIEKVSNFKSISEKEVVQIVHSICEDYTTDIPIDDEWWADLFSVIRENNISIVEGPGNLKESAFSNQLKSFLSHAWMNSEEQAVVRQLNLDKNKLIDNGDSGREYIKNFLQKNKGTLENNCTENFINELTNLSSYMTEAAAPLDKEQMLSKALIRLQKILDLQKENVWTLQSLKIALRDFIDNYQRYIDDNDFWDSINDAMNNNDAIEARATIKLAMERIKELENNSTVMQEQIEKSLDDLITEAINGGFIQPKVNKGGDVHKPFINKEASDLDEGLFTPKGGNGKLEGTENYKGETFEVWYSYDYFVKSNDPELEQYFKGKMFDYYGGAADYAKKVIDFAKEPETADLKESKKMKMSENINEAVDAELKSWLSGNDNDKPETEKKFDSISKGEATTKITPDKVKTTPAEGKNETESDMTFDNVEQWKNFFKDNFTGSVKYEDYPLTFEDEVGTICAYAGDEMIGEYRENIGTVKFTSFGELKDYEERKIDDFFNFKNDLKEDMSDGNWIDFGSMPSTEEPSQETFQSTQPLVKIKDKVFNTRWRRYIDSVHGNKAKIDQYNRWRLAEKDGPKSRIQNENYKEILQVVPSSWLESISQPAALTEDTTTASMAVPDSTAMMVKKPKLQQKKNQFFDFVKENCNIKGFMKDDKFDMTSYLASKTSKFKKKLVEAFEKDLKKKK